MKPNKEKWSLPVDVKNSHRWESQLKQAIANSESIQKAADSMGVSYNTFKSWCRKFGLLPTGDNPRGILKKIKENLFNTVTNLTGSSASAALSSSFCPDDGVVHWPKGFRYGDGNAPVAPVSTLSRVGGLRREYSSVEYMKERNAAISASLESSGPTNLWICRQHLF